VARLRPANVDPAAGALAELQRVIAAIQAQWPEVKIWVRGDSAYSRDDLMSWCEATPKVDYLFAQGSNAGVSAAEHPLERGRPQGLCPTPTAGQGCFEGRGGR
jgi:hypothetical protein